VPVNANEITKYIGSLTFSLKKIFFFKVSEISKGKNKNVRILVAVKKTNALGQFPNCIA